MNPYRTNAAKRETPKSICRSCGEVETESMFCAGSRRTPRRRERALQETQRRFDAWIERIAL